jgi:hypothetical protein
MRMIIHGVEREIGPGAYLTRATGRIPNFFASDTDALADIRACAAASVKP